jgi:predicted glycoside hydrolase/deacetylase ChbG (UPF0249 family)
MDLNREGFIFQGCICTHTHTHAHAHTHTQTHTYVIAIIKEKEVINLRIRAEKGTGGRTPLSAWREKGETEK